MNVPDAEVRIHCETFLPPADFKPFEMADRATSTFQAEASGFQATGTVATGFRLMSRSPGFGAGDGESGVVLPAGSVAPFQAEALGSTPMGPSVTDNWLSRSKGGSGVANAGSGEDVGLTWDASGGLMRHLVGNEPAGGTTGQWRRSVLICMYSLALVLRSLTLLTSSHPFFIAKLMGYPYLEP